MEKQMALFNTKKDTTKDQPTQLLEADKTYLAFPKGMASRLNIFQGGTSCQSIALDYVDNNHILGEQIEAICKRSNQTKPHHYYHYINHKFVPYDDWILKMILKTESKPKSDDKAHQTKKEGPKHD